MNKLILVRHGKTLENKLGIIQGWLDTSLSSEGIKQAEYLNSVFQKEKINHIYSSPLKRARQTIEIITNYKNKAFINYDDRLKEINMGLYEGLHKSQVTPEQMNNPPRGEDMKKIYNRTSDFIEELKEKYDNKTILIVSHNIILKTMLNHIKYGTYKPLDKNMSIKNSEIIYKKI